jgi:cobalt-zinc-cadmium efflux system outer membrane protein
MGGGAADVADAQLRVVAHEYLAVRRRLAQEIAAARVRLAQALRDWEQVRSVSLPRLATARDRAIAAHERGDLPLSAVLDAEQQMLALERREAAASAEVLRATAELDRSVGRRYRAASRS